MRHFSILAYLTQIFRHDVLEIHPLTSALTGTIFPGTIVPIRAAISLDSGAFKSMRMLGVLIACVVVGGAAYFWQDRQQAFAEKSKSEAERAVSNLPIGTERAWVSYVEQRFAAAIQLRAGGVMVTAQPDETFIVSRNTPTKITCDPVLGARVEFGYGDNSTSVSIYGFPGDVAPPLGVSRSSLAAASLSRTLCEVIAEKLSKLVQS